MLNSLNFKMHKRTIPSMAFSSMGNCHFIPYFITTFLIFLYLFLPVLGLHCWLFSSCREQGILSRCCTWASHWGGFSYCRAWALGHSGFSSCGSQALEHSLNSCGTGAQLLCSMWHLPRSAMEPDSLALVGKFLTTEPPGKPHSYFQKCN